MANAVTPCQSESPSHPNGLLLFSTIVASVWWWGISHRGALCRRTARRRGTPHPAVRRLMMTEGRRIPPLVHWIIARRSRWSSSGPFIFRFIHLLSLSLISHPDYSSRFFFVGPPFSLFPAGTTASAVQSAVMNTMLASVSSGWSQGDQPTILVRKIYEKKRRFTRIKNCQRTWQLAWTSIITHHVTNLLFFLQMFIVQSVFVFTWQYLCDFIQSLFIKVNSIQLDWFSPVSFFYIVAFRLPSLIPKIMKRSKLWWGNIIVDQGFLKPFEQMLSFASLLPAHEICKMQTVEWVGIVTEQSGCILRQVGWSEWWWSN